MNEEFMEYDTRSEKLVWCEKDICIFWSLKNDKITLRRLCKLEKRRTLQSSTINASTYYTNTQEQTHSPFAPAGGSSMYSPFLKSGSVQHGNKGTVMRVNRSAELIDP